MGVPSNFDPSILQVHPELVSRIAPNVRESGEARGAQLNHFYGTFRIRIVVRAGKQRQDPDCFRVLVKWLVDHLSPVFCLFEVCHADLGRCRGCKRCSKCSGQYVPCWLDKLCVKPTLRTWSASLEFEMVLYNEFEICLPSYIMIGLHSSSAMRAECAARLQNSSRGCTGIRLRHLVDASQLEDGEQ